MVKAGLSCAWIMVKAGLGKCYFYTMNWYKIEIFVFQTIYSKFIRMAGTGFFKQKF